MASEQIKKKLQNALKLSGFSVRREFCSLIANKFFEANLNLNDKHIFENCIRTLCSSLENQCLIEQSIEKEHIDRAIEVSLHSGYDKNETIFSVINAFNFPKLVYDIDRKHYLLDKRKSKILSEANSKAQMHLDRYDTILQRTKRNFQTVENFQLQTIDYLLTLSHVTLEKILILGALMQVSEGKYYLEDPTGMTQLDLSHAKYSGGFFVENCFVLVNGYYEDKILHVSTILLPPGEEYKDSRLSFGNLNYFGGPSDTPLKDSVKLREHLNNHPNDSILFFSDVFLDHPMVFEKLELLFDGLQNFPPVAFVFMGSFLSQSYGPEVIEMLKKLFKRLGELIANYPNLVSQSQFVFVPGSTDPCTPYMLPRFPLPICITEEISRVLPKAIFTSNPCRIQYCTKEIVVLRANVLPKFLQGTLHKSPKDQITENLTRTIISQGHLSPFSLNALTTHWDFDYTLRLYPLPDLIVIGDATEEYQGKYKGCQIINPGPFCDHGFQFKQYTPKSRFVEDEQEIQDCVL